MARGNYTSRSFKKTQIEKLEEYAEKHGFDNAKDLMMYATRRYLEDLKGENWSSQSSND
jgi:hypothetical protein